MREQERLAHLYFLIFFHLPGQHNMSFCREGYFLKGPSACFPSEAPRPNLEQILQGYISNLKLRIESIEIEYKLDKTIE